MRSAPVKGAFLAIAGTFALSTARGSAADPASSGARPRYTIDAAISREDSTVEGTVAIEPGAGARGPLRLVLYPERFASPPEAIDQRNVYWVYPHGFDPGGMAVVSCEGLSDAGERCVVVAGTLGEATVSFGGSTGADAPPGGVVLGFRVTVPERFGSFGGTGGTMVLGGGWHPLLAGRGEDGSSGAAAPIERADYAVTLHVPPGADVVIDGAGPYRCGEDRSGGCRIEHTSTGAEPPSVVVADRLFARSVEAAGVEVVLLSQDEAPDPRAFAIRPGRDLDSSAVPDLVTIDHWSRALEAVAGAIVEADGLGLLPPASRRPARVPIVVVPSRLDLTVGVEGAVLVSDRAYELFPLERALEFHDREVIRAVLTEIDRVGLAGRPLAEARWAAETAAAGTLEALDPAGAARRAEDLLRYGAFLPVVDQMIFAPLMEFRDVYYPAVEETDSLRDEIWRLGTDLPRGRRVWAKLRDRLGPGRALAAVRSALASAAPLREAATSEAGEDLSWFFDLWLGVYPAINLVLEGFSSEPVDGGGFRTTVRLRRDGDPSAREVVAVRVAFDDGSVQDAAWDAAQVRGEVVLTAAAPATRVEIDPDGRVVQDPALAAGNPRVDDASWLPWRLPVLDRIRLSIDLDDPAASEADIDVTMRRRYDLRQGLRGRFSRDPRGLGGSVAYLYGFGPPRDMNRPSWLATGYVEVFRWDAAFGEGGRAATTMGFGAIVSRDDRWYDVDPADGWQALLAAAGAFGLDADVWMVRAAGRGFYLWTPAAGHTLAFYGGLALTFGEPLSAQLEGLGDRYILRSLTPDEGLGRAKLYAVAEYRHAFTHDLDLNLFNLGWLRGVQGVLFGGFGTTSRSDSFDGMFGERRVFLEAGYGLRVFVDWGGVQTGVVSLDVAVPFAIVDGAFGIPEYAAADPDDRASYTRRPALFGLPMGAHLSFTQTF